MMNSVNFFFFIFHERDTRINFFLYNIRFSGNRILCDYLCFITDSGKQIGQVNTSIKTNIGYSVAYSLQQRA